MDWIIHHPHDESLAPATTSLEWLIAVHARSARFPYQMDPNVSSSSATLNESVRSALTAHVQQQQSQHHHNAEDVLRAFQEQSSLLYQTEKVTSSLSSDPFQCFGDIREKLERFKKRLAVTHHHSVLTKEGYSNIEATVRITDDEPPKSSEAMTIASIRLFFRYERRVNESVWYAIDMSKGHDEPTERMLWVRVSTSGNAPSVAKAKCVNEEDEDDDDLWSDMEDECDDNIVESSKAFEKDARITHAQNSGSNGKNIEEESGKMAMSVEGDQDVSCDRYIAGIDPDILEQFLQWTGLGPMNDITAFFLLMTFPFYEHEWDLVGFLLKAVFGTDSDSDSAGDSTASE